MEGDAKSDDKLDNSGWKGRGGRSNTELPATANKETEAEDGDDKDEDGDGGVA